MKKEYISKLARLREIKLEQTREKLDYEGYLDEDDYGRIVPTFPGRSFPTLPMETSME